MIGLGGREKLFFSRKKVFPFPQVQSFSKGDEEDVAGGFAVDD